MRIVFLNGDPMTAEAAVISVYDRGFLYGDSVFETIRTYGGIPFALERHMIRLARSADRVGITMPIPTEAFCDEILHALRHAGNPESYARVMVTRGEGPLGLDPDLAIRPNRVIFVEPLVLPSRTAYRDGIAVVLSRTARTTDQTSAAGAKVANYLMSLLALREAKRAGAMEALIVDGTGHVLEGTTSNVFMVRNHVLVTPPETAGILPGITRERLIDLAPKLGITLEIRPILETELWSAEEIFISSTVREILPIIRIDGRSVGAGVPGDLTRRLHLEFRRSAGVGGAMPWEDDFGADQPTRK
jgi:branched-chain amino acid aminotransferase